jgi:hypothetical protein
MVFTSEKYPIVPLKCFKNFNFVGDFNFYSPFEDYDPMQLSLSEYRSVVRYTHLMNIRRDTKEVTFQIGDTSNTVAVSGGG